MKVKIDYDLCMGDGECHGLCPEVFDYDDKKNEARVIVDRVPADLEDQVRKAAEQCDVSAIIVEE